MRHSVSYVMYISGAKFKEQEHCFNISGDIFDSVFSNRALLCVKR